jgi:hypothetical protein
MPILGRKEMAIIGFMSLTISLIGILTRGHNTRICYHIILSFLEMSSNFSTNSLSKCLGDLKRPMVDWYGDLVYKRRTSNYPLHDYLLQTKSYEGCWIYKKHDMQEPELSVDNIKPDII